MREVSRSWMSDSRSASRCRCASTARSRSRDGRLRLGEGGVSRADGLLALGAQRFRLGHRGLAGVKCRVPLHLERGQRGGLLRDPLALGGHGLLGHLGHRLRVSSP